MKTLKEQAREHLEQKVHHFERFADKSYVQGNIIGAVRMLYAIGIINNDEREEMMNEYLDKAGV